MIFVIYHENSLVADMAFKKNIYCIIIYLDMFSAIKMSKEHITSFLLFTRYVKIV